jgi:hypothetical protein
MKKITKHNSQNNLILKDKIKKKTRKKRGLSCWMLALEKNLKKSKKKHKTLF